MHTFMISAGHHLRRILRKPASFPACTALVGVALLLTLFAAIGHWGPPRASNIRTDRLGPEPGEPVSAYLQRAHDSVTTAGTDARWALVSFTEYQPPERLPDAVRIASVLYHVPLPRVHTPLVAVTVPGGATALRRSAGHAAGQLRAPQLGAAPQDRPAKIAAVAADKLRRGCACVAGVVVSGEGDQLRQLANQPKVRAVQALPADAVAGSFAVVPLLPEHTDVVIPGPDDGPIPDR